MWTSLGLLHAMAVLMVSWFHGCHGIPDLARLLKYGVDGFLLAPANALVLGNGARNPESVLAGLETVRGEHPATIAATPRASHDKPINRVRMGKDTIDIGAR